MFTIIPFFINSAISFTKFIPIFSDNSFKVKTSQTITVPVFAFKFCFISSTFFSIFLLVFAFALEKPVSTASLNLLYFLPLLYGFKPVFFLLSYLFPAPLLLS